MAENPLHSDTNGGLELKDKPFNVVVAQPGAVDDSDDVAPLHRLESGSTTGGETLNAPRASVSLDHFDHDQLGSGLYTQQVPVDDFSYFSCYGESDYKVFGLGRSKKGRAGKVPRLFMRERSPAICRAVCSACRPATTTVYRYDEKANDIGPKMLLAEKSCGCQTLPCCRSGLKVSSFHEDGTQEIIGEVIDPFSCCGVTLNIRTLVSATKSKWYKISGPRTNRYAFCPWKPYVAEITGEKKSERGKVTKLSAEACSGTNTYALEFPEDEAVTNREKACLLGAQIFMEHAYFERGSGDRCARPSPE